MLRAPEPPLELRPITAPGSTHISMLPAPCTTSNAHANTKAKQGSCLCPQRHGPSTLSTRHLSPARPWPNCHMPQRGRRCRSGRKLPTTQRAAVGRGTLSKAGTSASHQAVMVRPYRAGLVRAGQQRRRSVAIRDLQAALDTCRRAQKSERASRPLRVVAGGRAPRP